MTLAGELDTWRKRMPRVWYGNDLLERTATQLHSMELDRDQARELAVKWRENAWCSNTATSPFPWEEE